MIEINLQGKVNVSVKVEEVEKWLNSYITAHWPTDINADLAKTMKWRFDQESKSFIGIADFSKKVKE